MVDLRRLPVLLAAVSVTAAAQPNYVISDMRVDPTSVRPGGEVEVECRVENRGNRDVGSNTDLHYLLFYNSGGQNRQITETDRVSPLDAGEESAWERATIDIPSNADPGPLLIFCRSDAGNDVDETNETDNNRSFQANIIQAGPPDLVVEDAEADPVWEVGGTASLRAYVANRGDQSTGSTRLGYYLVSQDGSREWGLGDDRVSGLSPGERSRETATVSVPGAPPGSYFVRFRADDRNEEDEGGGEGNNDRLVTGIEVMVPPADLTVAVNVTPSSGGAGASFTATCQVTNDGGGATSGGVPVAVAFLQGTNQGLVGAERLADMGAGQSRSVTYSSTVPGWAVEGAAEVRCVATYDGGGVAGNAPFSVSSTSVPPALSGVDPDPVPAQSGRQWITFSGSGLQPGVRVQLRDLTNGGTFDIDAGRTDRVDGSTVRVYANVTDAEADWDARATNPDGLSSARLPFRVARSEVATGTPEPLGPGRTTPPGETLSSLTPQLSWSAVGGASGYTVYVSEYPYGTPNLVVEQPVSGTTVTLGTGALEPGRQYRWNVSASLPDGDRFSFGRLYFQTPTASGGAPAVTAVSPSSPNTGVRTLTLNGSSFPPDMSVTLLNVEFGGQVVVSPDDVDFVSSGEARVTVDLGNTSADWTVAVGSGAQTSSPFPFRVVRRADGAAAPSLASASPSSIEGDGRPRVVTLYGTGLEGCRVLLAPVGGSEVAVAATTSGPNTLEFEYAFPAEAATWTARVETPGGVRSSSVSISVTTPQTVGARTFTIGALTLQASRAEETSTGVYLVEGTATIGGVLTVNNASFTANTGTGLIQGSGQIAAHGSSLLTGSFSVNVSGSALTFAGNGLLSALDVAGAKLTVRSIAFVGDELSLSGKLKLLAIETDVADLRIRPGGYDLRSTVTLPTIGLPLGSPVAVPALRGVTLDIDTATRSFSGTGELVMPLMSFEGTVGITGGQLDRFGLGASGFTAIPLGSTGFGITGSYAEISGLARPPLAVTMRGDIAPLVPGAFNNFLMEDVGFTYTSRSTLRASGALTIFGQRVAGAGFTVSPSRIEADANVDLIDLVRGEAQIGLSRSGSSVQVTGSMKGSAVVEEDLIRGLPGGRGIVGTLKFFGARFPVILDAPAMRFNNSGLRVTQEVRSVTLCVDVPFSAPFVPDPRCTVGGGPGRSASRIAPGGLPPEGGTFGADAPNTALRMTATGMEQRFSVGDGIETLYLVVDKDGGAPSVRLHLPDGSEIGPGTSDDLALYIEAPEEDFVALTVQSPPSGVYVLVTEGQDPHRLEVASRASEGAVVVDELRVSGDAAEVRWRGLAAADGAGVSLYYDDDGEGFNGVLIEGGLPSTSTGSYAWTPPEGLATGDYHVYVSVGDGSRAVYAPGAYRYVPSGAPAPPAGVDARTTVDGVVVTWTPADARSYTVYHAQRGAPSYSGASVDAGAGRAVVVDGLAPGRTYAFAVSARDANGVEGALSETHSVTYVSATENNAPTVVPSSAPDRAAVGVPIQVDLQADDPDGDALFYDLRQGPEGMALSESGRLTWTPTESQLGPSAVRFVVRDGEGAADSLAFRVQVAPPGGGKGTLTLALSRYGDYDTPVVATLVDPDLDVTADRAEQAEVRASGTAGAAVTMVLTETSASSGRFVGSLRLSADGADGSLRIAEGDTLRVVYADAAPSAEVSAAALFGGGLGPVSNGSEPVGADPSVRTYPNPAVHRVYFEYSVAETAPVSVEVFDVRGRHVATLADGVVAAGTYTALWDVSVAPGVYVIRLSTSTSSGPVYLSRRVVVAR